jgi:hypothetical protein
MTALIASGGTTMRHPFLGAAIGAVVGFFGVFVVALLELVSEGMFGWPTWNDSLSNRFQDYFFAPGAPWNLTVPIGVSTAVCAAIGLVLGMFYRSSLATRR